MSAVRQLFKYQGSGESGFGIILYTLAVSSYLMLENKPPQPTFFLLILFYFMVFPTSRCFLLFTRVNRDWPTLIQAVLGRTMALLQPRG